MYETLIVHLRECAKFDPSNNTYTEAADAIEELSSQLDDFKRLCFPLKENRLYKYSDGNFVEVFLILPSEPPKEG